MSDVVSWAIDGISDATYRSQFVDVADHLANWTADFGGLDRKDILDFGCGDGVTALGVALRYTPRQVVGVDIAPKFDTCLPNARKQLGLSSLPSQLRFATVAPDASIDDSEQFDVIYSWSVFEHVSQELVGNRLLALKTLLRPNGIVFIQVAPLYFSAEGSHMGQWLPEPWAHLILQNDRFEERVMAGLLARGADMVHWHVYETLNKITAPQLRKEMEEVGFEILRDYRTRDELQIPWMLRNVYQEDVLLTNQVVLMAKHGVAL